MPAVVLIHAAKMTATDDTEALQACLDYSFYNLTEVAEIAGEEPRIEDKKGRTTRTAKQTEGKYAAGILKLNNNSLSDMNSLMPTLETVLHNPMSLVWLDLSFNALTKIDAIICELQNLKILYYHGNQVADMKEVDKLAGLSQLNKLSLHGNPIEKDKGYKCYVLCRMTGLRNFDMCTITSIVRRNMEIDMKLIGPLNQKKKKKAAAE